MMIVAGPGRKTDRRSVAVWVVCILLLAKGFAVPALLLTLHLPQRRP